MTNAKKSWTAMTHETKGAVLSHPDGKLIAECGAEHADLIAAAPELLEAAETMLDFCNSEDAENFDEVKSKLVMAINKAKGGGS